MTKTFVAAILTLAATSTVGCSDKQFSVQAAADTAVGHVERGKYLVAVLGCNDCHTPLKMGANGPEPDMARFLTGHPEQMGSLPTATPRGPWLWAGAATNPAFSAPWGISYAAN